MLSSVSAITPPNDNVSVIGGNKSNTPVSAASRTSEAIISDQTMQVICAWSKGNVGDSNQCAGIKAALTSALSASAKVASQSLELVNSSSQTKAEQLEAACAGWVDKLNNRELEKVVFILAGSGECLASTLGADANRHPSFISVFTGHQFSLDLKHAANLPQITALPKSLTINPEDRAQMERKTRLVLVSGVAHQISAQTISDTVNDYKSKGYKQIPFIDSNTIAVILGGDAPDESGQQKLFF